MGESKVPKKYKTCSKQNNKLNIKELDLLVSGVSSVRVVVLIM